MDAIDELQNTIKLHSEKIYLSSFSKNTRGGNSGKRKRSDVNNPGEGGGTGRVRATDCPELRAHGYEVRPERETIADESGEHVMQLRSRVRQPLLSSTAR